MWGARQAEEGEGTRRMGQEGCSSYPRRGAPEPHLITGESHQPLLGSIGISPPSTVSSSLSVLQGGPSDRDTPAAGEFLESPMEWLSFLRRESSAPAKPTGISESVPSARSWAQRLGSCGEWNAAPPSTVSWAVWGCASLESGRLSIMECCLVSCCLSQSLVEFCQQENTLCLSLSQIPCFPPHKPLPLPRFVYW